MFHIGAIKKIAHDLRLAPKFIKLVYYQQKAKSTLPKNFIHSSNITYSIVDDSDNELNSESFETKINNLNEHFNSINKKNSIIAIRSQNDADSLASIISLMKNDITFALIPKYENTHALRHYLNSCRATHLLSDKEIDNLSVTSSKTFQIDTKKCLNLYTLSSSSSQEGQNAPYVMVFTSGTSGLPKAVNISFYRLFQEMAMYYVLACKKRQEVIYLTLPMCHRDGLLFSLMSVFYGLKLIIRNKYSSNRFFYDLNKYKFTVVPYLGEIVRYVSSAADLQTSIPQSITCWNGSGISKQSWEKIKHHWPRSRIIETYGSSEGNVGLLNHDYLPGSAGSIPFYAKRLFSVELVVQNTADPHKHSIVRDSGAGEAVGLVPKHGKPNYCNYAGDDSNQDRFIYNLASSGDIWCRTFDLFYRNEIGYYYFRGRSGRNYRWKSINTSSLLVEEIIEQYPDVKEAVCGPVQIPGYEGSAGHVIIYKNDKFDVSAFSKYANSNFTSESIPLFIRISDSSADVTETYKKRYIDVKYSDLCNREDIYYFDRKSNIYMKFSEIIATELESGKL